MGATREVQGLGLAGLAMIAAAAGVAGLGGWLRARAARTSHELPQTESWFADDPAPDPARAGRGRKLFLGSCAHCHGADARGDEGPDLHDLQVSSRYIANTIRRGIRGEMPSFAKKHNDADVSALVAYVRSLAAD